MIGSVNIKVKDSRNSYVFELRRNITVLCGESGRGKTTLFEMISDFNRYGKNSGIKVICDKPVIAISGEMWKERIANVNNSVVVIDEDNKFVRTKEFAEIIKNSSNYYLLITRVELEQLPISVEEIYKIVGNKNKKFERMYHHVWNMYDSPTKSSLPFRPELIITEDSKSGYQFFRTIAENSGIECISAMGKSNLYELLKSNKDKSVVVIADGAALGTQICNLVERQRLYPKKIAIFLPESFEWLLLKSGVVESVPVDLNNPENFIDSSKYFSWERYFTDILVQTTKDIKYMKYPKNKGKLPAYYIQDKTIASVKKMMEGLEFS